jgi:hypothetical protein
MTNFIDNDIVYEEGKDFMLEIYKEGPNAFFLCCTVLMLYSIFM